MTFDELKALVLAAAVEQRDDWLEADGENCDLNGARAAWIHLFASVGACRIVKEDNGGFRYTWTLDPDPRREADERLWAAMEEHCCHPASECSYELWRAIQQHREAINAGKPA